MDVSIRKVGPERIDDLAPLWKELVRYQAEIDPKPTGIPVRTPEGSWPYRRAEYHEWLAQPGAFASVAEAEGLVIGYALVSLHRPADDHWVTRDRWAELRTLVVLPERRGSGVGSLLMDAVHEELRGLGVRELLIGVVATNEEALRFYRRFGYRPWMVELLGAIPGSGGSEG